MAHIYRLIVYLILALGALPVSALTVQTSWSYVGSVGCTTPKPVNVLNSSMSAIASAVAAAANAGGCGSNHYSVGTVNNTSGSFVLVCSGNGNCGGTVYATAGGAVCPANSTNIATGCSCVTGYIENAGHNACIVDPLGQVCTLLKGETTYVTVPGSLSPGASVCGEIGCMLKLDDSLMRITDKTTGVKTTQGDATITDQPCSADPLTDAEPTECEGTPGTVNGVTVCLPANTDDGQLEQAECTHKTLADGTTVDTCTTTTCSGAQSCQTITNTTTTPPGGVPTTTTETESKPMPAFCEENPTVAICKTETGTFSGSCGSAPSCTGDAVLCAVAQATFELNCTLKTHDDASTAKYTAAAAQTSAEIKSSLDGGTFAINASTFDQTELLGAASCISDKSITVSGHSITVPFSMVCSSLATLGQLLVAVSMLLAARILVRG